MKGRTSQALFLISCAAMLSWVLAVNAQQSDTQTSKPKICVVGPDVQFGQGINAATDPAAPITATFVTDLSGSAVDIAALKSRVPLQINAEAAQQSLTARQGFYAGVADRLISPIPREPLAGEGRSGAIAQQAFAAGTILRFDTSWSESEA